MTQDQARRVEPGLKVATRHALMLCADEEIHDLVEHWLTAAGIHASSASDPKSVANRILEEAVELLVLDTLPIYLQGLPSLRRLKEERPSLRVILIPRLDEKPEVGIAHISGVDAVLARPLSKTKLLSAVRPLE
jgi:DNA-binding response OmpR family regulator